MTLETLFGPRFYLMHGTSPDGALGITDSGFRLDLTGSHAGTMFGSLVSDFVVLSCLSTTEE